MQVLSKGYAHNGTSTVQQYSINVQTVPLFTTLSIVSLDPSDHDPCFTPFIVRREMKVRCCLVRWVIHPPPPSPFNR